MLLPQFPHLCGSANAWPCLLLLSPSYSTSMEGRRQADWTGVMAGPLLLFCGEHRAVSRIRVEEYYTEHRLDWKKPVEQRIILGLKMLQEIHRIKINKPKSWG